MLSRNNHDARPRRGTPARDPLSRRGHSALCRPRGNTSTRASDYALERISRDIEARRIEACPFDQRRHSSQHVVSRQSERPLTPRPARAQSAAGVLTTYESTRPRPHAHMRPVTRQDSSLAINHAQQNSELHNTHQDGRGAGCSSAFSARGRRHWNRCATKENALYLETLRVLVKPNLTDAIRPRRS